MFYKHWSIKDIVDGYAWLESPTMITDRDGTKIFTNFSAKRQLYIQFKRMEVFLEWKGMVGWIVNTEINRPDIMILIHKAGGQPYHMDKGLIWFKKEL